MVGLRNSLWCVAWLLGVLAGCAQKASRPEQAPTAAAREDVSPSQRTLFILVHGTYAAESRWCGVVEGEATFASELQRGFGGDCAVRTFVWRTSFEHRERAEATKNLVAMIGRESAGFDQVVLIGHSHGGNVAMLAAAESPRRIDWLFCLATPHVYLRMLNAQDEEVHLPIYCSPETLDRVDHLCSLSGTTDWVPGEVAQTLPSGVTTNEALGMTGGWQATFSHLRLRNDDPTKPAGLTMRARKWINQVVRVPILELGDMAASPELTVPSTPTRQPTNFSVYLDSSPSGGAGPTQPHGAMHSRRMGYVLGETVRRGLTTERREFLAQLAQPSDADDGEPIASEERDRWYAEHAADVNHAGFLLEELRLEITPTAAAQSATLFDSEPDPLVILRATEIADGSDGDSDGGSTWRSDLRTNSRIADWLPDFRVGRETWLEVEVLDAEWNHALPESVRKRVSRESSLGVGKLHVRGVADSRVSEETSGEPRWSATLQWRSLHY